MDTRKWSARSWRDEPLVPLDSVETRRSAEFAKAERRGAWGDPPVSDEGGGWIATAVGVAALTLAVAAVETGFLLLAVCCVRP